MATATDKAGGGEFLQTLKMKTAASKRASTKGPDNSRAGTGCETVESNNKTSSSPLAISKKKSSFMQGLVRRASLVRVFNRTTSNDTSVTDEEEGRGFPPMSPIVPAGAKSVQGSRQTSASQPELLASPRRMSKPLPTSSPAMLSKNSRSSMEYADRRVSRLVLSEDDELPGGRERTPSLTSVDFMYAKSGDDNFEMKNPIHGGKHHAETKQAIEDDEISRQKRRSLYVSAASHIDQATLLSSRPHARSSVGRRGSVSLEPSSESSRPYTREAFSNPEQDVVHSPLISGARKASSRQSETQPIRKTSGWESRRRESSSGTVGSGSPGPSRLRQKRANSRLLHDKANYSNNVLINVPDAAGQTMAKIRRQELTTFLQDNPAHTPQRMDAHKKATFLLERYNVEDLALPLFRLYGKLPKGWDTFLEVDMRIRYRKLNPEERIEHDDSGLEHNLKGLLGDTSFVASDQLSRFRKMQEQGKTKAT